MLKTWNFFAIGIVSLYRLLTINLQVVTAQWNFLHSFLTLILRNAFECILKFRLIFINLPLFRVRDLELLCDQYSFTVPTFNYSQIITVYRNFPCRFLSVILSNIFWFVLEFQIFLWKLIQLNLSPNPRLSSGIVATKDLEQLEKGIAFAMKELRAQDMHRVLFHASVTSPQGATWVHWAIVKITPSS